jgi:2-dehydro-3-deoxyphosphooctonate aldolase (KDO 8-P synthase)
MIQYALSLLINFFIKRILMILISGPCVIESKEIAFKIAQQLNKYHQDSSIDFYFKASFDKANRTSLDSFRGPGLKDGLEILDNIKREFGYKILTDIHEASQAEEIAKVADVIQIPAFLSRQTDLLVASAKTDAIINIKKGQFLAPNQMKHSINKVLQTRGVKEVNYQTSKDNRVWLTERGSTFGYGNLVVDMRSLEIMANYAPVIFDVTHSVQMPGMGDGKSSGDSSFVAPLARAGAGAGVDGFFFETHFDPSQALSDGANMVDLDELSKIVDDIQKIQKVLK